MLGDVEVTRERIVNDATQPRYFQARRSKDGRYSLRCVMPGEFIDYISLNGSAPFEVDPLEALAILEGGRP
jgi:hypothetical protein